MSTPASTDFAVPVCEVVSRCASAATPRAAAARPSYPATPRREATVEHAAPVASETVRDGQAALIEAITGLGGARTGRVRVRAVYCPAGRSAGGRCAVLRGVTAGLSAPPAVVAGRWWRPWLGASRRRRLSGDRGGAAALAGGCPASRGGGSSDLGGGGSRCRTGAIASSVAWTAVQACLVRVRWAYATTLSG